MALDVNATAHFDHSPMEQLYFNVREPALNTCEGRWQNVSFISSRCPPGAFPFCYKPSPRTGVCMYGCFIGPRRSKDGGISLIQIH